MLKNDHITTRVRELVSELSIDYSGSPLVIPLKGEGLQPGERAPDALIERDGNQLRLHELLRGAGHHLILLGDEDVDLATLELLSGEISVLAVRHNYKEGSLGVIDRRGAMASAYGLDRAYLIRPDGYVGATCDFGSLPDILRQYAVGLHSQPRALQPKASLL